MKWQAFKDWFTRKSIHELKEEIRSSDWEYTKLKWANNDLRSEVKQLREENEKWLKGADGKWLVDIYKRESQDYRERWQRCDEQLEAQRLKVEAYEKRVADNVELMDRCFKLEVELNYYKLKYKLNEISN